VVNNTLTAYILYMLALFINHITYEFKLYVISVIDELVITPCHNISWV